MPGPGFTAPSMPKPPAAEKHPREFTLHGERLTDDYAWLRDKSDPRVIAHLEAENAYAEYKYNKQWTFRAGYSHTDQPISKGDVEFNILAPAVIDDHVTLGFTYTRDNGDEVTAAYMHGFENDVKGPSLFFGQNAVDKIEMSQDAVGIQYSWKL